MSTLSGPNPTRRRREPPVTRCPYDDCPFEGTQAEVDDHVGYLGSCFDPDHAPDKLKDRH